MAGHLPDGDPPPSDGSLPSQATAEIGTRPLAWYFHVPFCAVRCGYCDFNTYAPGETTSTTDQFVDAALAEVRLAARVLQQAPAVDTVFFGGGTPTLLPSADLLRLLDGVRAEFGLSAGAEVTTEANPDSVSLADLQVLREGGVTRISFGMQSSVPHVLGVLDRTHDPERVPQAIAWARSAGFEQVSLDLIYGTPGESADDWVTSVEAALACSPDHLSAYSLIVEDGTALARRVRRGEVAMPDEDDAAEKYLAVDQLCGAGGLDWYEISNWARPGSECRHNLHYWRGANWWGVGPGAHSHVGGVRWWNRKLPSAYAQALAAGESPAAGREVLDPPTRHLERVLLGLRLREGLPVDLFGSALPELISEGLIVQIGDRAALTRRGRLLADAVTRRII